ncbi:hypothetical protein B9Z55_020213 [Caenorhabditis nigoni]|uniref:SPK domain-containing protein n=1 Tax=Caenorhabditis nigoni TaxID=1611254 RepID=A0A2G5TLQ6_9PELO|nr:hypothetical protein B9Z55_020213 [Caenorhabditis nigoni]
MEKLQLAFIFSRPVSDGFVQKLEDAKFKIKQDKKKRISHFSTEDGRVVRFSDHYQWLKCFQGVLTGAKMAREEKRDQQTMENDNTGAERKQGSEQLEPMQEELDWEVKKETVEDISLEEKPKQEVDEDVTIGGSFLQETFNGRINYEELDAQEFVYPGFPQTAESKSSIRVQKRRQSSTTNSGKPAKTPDEQKISVLALATHIENIAAYYNFESLQKKASLAMEKMNKTEDKALSIKKFNITISFMLICLEENRIHEVEDSIKLKSLFKHIRSFLIRPLGPQIVHEALESIDQKIEEFENKNDGVAPTIISESLTHLLMATGF